MIRRLLVAAAAIVAIAFVIIVGAAWWLLSGDGVRHALESQASTWLGQPVRIGSASAHVLPRLAIRLSNVQVGDPVRLTLAELDVTAPIRGLLQRRIEDATMTVSNSRIEMPLPFSMPAGNAPAGSASGAAIHLVSVRSIALHTITIVSRGRSIVLSGNASLRGEQLTIDRLDATSGNTSLQASGNVALQPRVDAQLRVNANTLDLDELLALANAFSPPGSSSGAGPLPLRIAARISAASARAAGIDARNFATQLQVQGGNVSLSPINFQLFGGRYEGAFAAQLGETMSATLRARLSDLDVAALAAFGGVPGTVSGRLSGAGSFSGRGDTVAAVLRSGRGNGTASIVNGTIQHLDLVRTVVLFFGRPAADTAAASDRFDRIDVRLDLHDQVVHADPFSLHSPDADLVGDGSLTLPTNVLAGHVDMSLSAELSAQAGTDLARFTREGNRIVLPATIGGTLGSPRLGIDAAAAARRGLRNEVQRRLEGLLDRFKPQP
jgi:hypothetical protein